MVYKSLINIKFNEMKIEFCREQKLNFQEFQRNKIAHYGKGVLIENEMEKFVVIFKRKKKIALRRMGTLQNFLLTRIVPF